MPSMIENVFIFGVILPAVVTVAVFLIFLVCWFKCNIRQKLQNKFCNKRKTQGENTSGAADRTSSPKGGAVHYIQENLDYSSSTGHDRHSASEAQHIQAIPMHDTGHLANMGFEIGEDFHRNYSGSARTYSTNLDQSPAGPSSSPSHHSPSSYSFGRCEKPISSSPSPVEKRSCDRITVHMDSGSTAVLTGAEVVSDNTRQHKVSKNTSESIHGHAITATTPQSIHHPSPTHSTMHLSEQNTSNMSQIRQWTTSPHTSFMRVSSNVTPGVHKPVTTNKPSPLAAAKTVSQTKRVEYIQQVFQFPHGSKHHKSLTKVSRNTAVSSLDNSSSSYSSSSNDGDYFDREGDYGQFYPVSQHTTEQQHQLQNTDIMYTRGSSTGRNSSSHGIRHGNNVHLDTSPTSYQKGQSVTTTKGVYYSKHPTGGSYHSEGLSETFKHPTHTQDTHYTQSSSSSQYSSHPYGDLTNAGTNSELSNVHFISQEV